MALSYSTHSDLGSSAPHFSLPGVDGKIYSLDTFQSYKALLIVFMCNHCPYVIAVHERLSALAREFEPRDIAMIGINSNDPKYRIEDSFENMKMISKEWKLPFPYVFDETQNTAREYDAVCTPDPYLYENVEGDFKLRYRGRIDDSWKDPKLAKAHDLKNAMNALSLNQAIAKEQLPSMGCSIKWKN